MSKIVAWKKTFERIRAEISKLNVFVYEHILGIHIVKIFNQQKKNIKKKQKRIYQYQLINYEKNTR